MTHGGKREGAGRKQRAAATRRNLYLSDAVYEYLKRNGNASAEIEQITRKQMENTMAATRKEKAQELLENLETGPAISPAPFTTLTPEQVAEVSRQYRIWARTWIIPALRELCARDLPPATENE